MKKSKNNAASSGMECYKNNGHLHCKVITEGQAFSPEEMVSLGRLELLGQVGVRDQQLFFTLGVCERSFYRYVEKGQN